MPRNTELFLKQGHTKINEKKSVFHTFIVSPKFHGYIMTGYAQIGKKESGYDGR